MLNTCYKLLKNQLIRQTYSKFRYIKISASVYQQNISNEQKQEGYENVEKTEITKDVDYMNMKISTKIHQKQPQRAPLVKNFFLGEVDKELMIYPEVLQFENLPTLYAEIDPIGKYFNENRDKLENIDATRTISKDILNELLNLRLFGSNIPQHLGGKGYIATETMLSTEPEAQEINIASMLSAHREVTEILLQYGTEDQRIRYLPRLAKGELIATSAIFESKPTDSELFLTKAKPNEDNKSWKLNGTKSFVLNGNEASLFLVLAQTKNLDFLGDSQESISVFLVDANTPGVIKSSPDINLGIRGLKQINIEFNNVTIPSANIIGEVGGGNVIGQKFFDKSRLQNGLITTIALKKYIAESAEFCIKTKHLGTNLMEMELYRDRISRIVCDTYGLESAIYLTTGLIDGYQDQDINLECAIIKAFGLSSLWNAVTESMMYRGPNCLNSGEKIEEFLRNSAQFLIQGEPLDSVKLYIGLTGLQYAGISLNALVKKIRNPMFNPSFIFGRILGRQSIESPKLNLQLHHNLHLSLDPAAQYLELSLVRLRMATEMLLGRHGPEVINKQVDVLRLSEAASLIYIMFASVCRASRAYCIGLRHADYEMLIANVLCLDKMERVKALVIDISKGEFITNDNHHQKIGKQTFKSKGYFSEHPLTRNF